MRTVQIADKSYAVGLWWQVRPGGPAKKKIMLKLARETAAGFASDQYNCVAIRQHQYGLGAMQLRRAQDIFPGNLVPLAAALRPLGNQDAFLGIFCLTEGLWWVCGIVRGIIAADGDAIFSTEEEARAAASSLRMLIEDVGIVEVVHTSPEASREYLAPLLWPEPSLVPLHDTNRRQRLSRLGMVGVVLLAVSAVAYWVYEEYQVREQSRLIAQQAIAKDAQRKDQLAHPERYFKKNWLSAPSILDAGKQCSELILSLPLVSNAWMLEEATCSPAENLMVTWAHAKGASFVEPPAGAEITSPQRAMERRTLPRLPPRLSNRSLLTKNDATAVLYQITQNTGSQVTLSWEAPEQFRIDNKTSVTAPWQRGNFEFKNLPAQTALGPDLFGALSLPGVMFTSVTLHTQNSTWTIKGSIYAGISSKR